MKTVKIFGFVLLFVALALSACNLPSDGSAGDDPNAMFTQAAQTVQAQLTQTVSAVVGPVSASATPLTPNAPLPSATPFPTAALPPTAVPKCDAITFIADVTIPDGTVFTPGVDFTKTWRLKNNGSCTWTTDYELIFIKGHGMNGPATKRLPQAVLPGETIDLSLDLRAPMTANDYRGHWQLRNANGVVFGIGNGANESFWVDIKVVAPSSDARYDFALNFCTAEWRSAADDNLPCPGKEGNDDGFVILLTEPVLESRHENEPALVTHPDNAINSWITGIYPPFLVEADDHFVAWIGCMDASDDCDVSFKLDYQIDGGAVKNLGEWAEVYDDSITHVDVELSSLAGEKVSFILSVVIKGGVPEDANAFWFVPLIEQD